MISPADNIIKRRLAAELELYSDFTAVENVRRELHCSTATLVRLLAEIVKEEETKRLCHLPQ